jgi:hypothetical protein
MGELSAAGLQGESQKKKYAKSHEHGYLPSEIYFEAL